MERAGYRFTLVSIVGGVVLGSILMYTIYKVPVNKALEPGDPVSKAREAARNLGVSLEPPNISQERVHFMGIIISVDTDANSMKMSVLSQYEKNSLDVFMIRYDEDTTFSRQESSLRFPTHSLMRPEDIRAGMYAYVTAERGAEIVARSILTLCDTHACPEV